MRDEAMGSTVNHFEILKPIVKLVMIEVMHDFGRLQGPAQMALHDMPMLVDLPIVHPDNAVTQVLGNGALAFDSPLSSGGIASAQPAMVMADAHAPCDPAAFVAIHAGLHRGTLYHKGTLFARGTMTKPGEFKETLARDGEGNLEPSLGYSPGRCRDYWRGRAPLITSTSARRESDEIVQSWGKPQSNCISTVCS
jgi:hypothetical protein